MSPREETAQNLLDTCVCGGLDEVYGASKEKRVDGKGKSYWSITFCKARVLDGEIRVYSERFVQVRWQTAFRDMRRDGSEVFRNEAAAKLFLQQSFIRGT